MSLRAPCLSEAVARAYADPESSSSSPSSPRPKTYLQRRTRRQHYSSRSVIASLLLILLALPIASAIFDPGQADVVEEPPVASPSPKPPRLSSSGDSSISLIAPKGRPISLHPGCKRTSDLFDNVCHEPWSPFSTTPRKSHLAVHSELVICPMGETTENGEKEKVFAITGTITLPESTYADVEAASSSIVPSTTLGDKEAHWPKPGDEGFWRQRDGELEWVPTEVRALLESDPIEGDVSPAFTAKTESKKEEGGNLPEVAHEEEYHAWSESVGGEESKTWLSFEQWRENHLAAEKEQEKQRIAAGRKQKNDKAKEKKIAQGQASNATDKAVEVHSPGSIDDLNTTRIGGVQNSTTSPLPSEIARDGLPEETQAALDETAAGQPPSEPPIEVAIDDAVEPTVVKSGTSQDTGTISAIGDSASQLSTLKHRWNFASFDCAAVVHRANPSAKFTSAILSEKKDRYMLSPCPQGDKDPQFVVVELCDEISVDTIVLANYEFFSRMFKRFRVRVARNLNGGEADWYDIGTFRAKNVRGLQVFNTTPPKADSRFFRYVRIDFLEHYGSEYYCPVSLLRVYGLTQMDDYIREEEEMRKQKEAELTLADSESVEEEEEEEANKAEPENGDAEASIAPATTSAVEPKKSANLDHEEEIVQPIPSQEAPKSLASAAIAAVTSVLSPEQAQPAIETMTETIASLASSVAQSIPSAVGKVTAPRSNGSEEDNLIINDTLLPGAEGGLGKPIIDLGKASENQTVAKNGSQIVNESIANVTSPSQPLSTNDTAAGSSQAANTSSPVEIPSAASPLNATAAGVPVVEAKERVVNATIATASTAQPISSTEASKPAGTGQQQQQPNAGGSESIYRTITKRLNTLEMNATLSLQYMEHSRQQLREVFGRMERNQRDKIAEMLKELNASNWRQIESLKRRQQVDLQQAIFEFDKHRQQTDSERRQLLAQMHILSNEVILEKRFGIAQLVLLLGLFVFMALTRGSRATPLINQGIARISSKSNAGVQHDTLTAPPSTVRASAGMHGHIDSRAKRLPPPSPAAMRSYLSNRPFLTPRVDRFNRGLDRTVPLRGHSHSKSSSAKRPKSASLLALSPLPIRKSDASISSLVSQRRGSDSTSSSQQDHSTSLISANDAIPRPAIILDTGVKADVELETPISRVASRARSSTFNREGTPTNLSEARQLELGKLPSLPSGSALSESYGSDWGTERSDEDEESRTSFSINDNGAVSDHADGLSESSLSTTAVPPFRSPIRRIEESDAEEDSSPKWNSVKSRRSLKRPNSSGGNGLQSHLSNGHSRGNTPPSHLIPTPTRRTFSPFHKNAEIEIN